MQDRHRTDFPGLKSVVVVLQNLIKYCGAAACNNSIALVDSNVNINVVVEIADPIFNQQSNKRRLERRMVVGHVLTAFTNLRSKSLPHNPSQQAKIITPSHQTKKQCFCGRGGIAQATYHDRIKEKIFEVRVGHRQQQCSKVENHQEKVRTWTTGVDINQ